MDNKYVVTLILNLVGLGLMGWQIRIMKRQLEDLPSPRSAKRVAFEKRLSRKLYFPVFVMGGLILLSWLPLVIGANQSPRLPHFVLAWGGSVDGCTASIDTSGFVKLAERERMFLVCRAADPTVDQMEDDKIAISKPFQITGGVITITVIYDPSSRIKQLVVPGAQTWANVILLPKDEDGSRIRKLADVEKVGGQIVLEGGKLKL